MPDEAAYATIRTWLGQSRRPLILTHRKPDGDALGAVAAMTPALGQMGQHPTPLLYEPFPPRYPFLESAVAWQIWDRSTGAVAAADSVIILDTCSWSQLEPVAEFLKSAPRTLVIDHHPTRDPIATRPGDLRFFDEPAAATCVLIAEWIQYAGLTLSREIAEALFAGIATDSGWFRFSNTDARTLRVAATLCDAGVKPAALYRPIYERDPAAKLMLIGRMLLSLRILAGGRLAVMTLRRTDFTETGADRSMTEDLVNEAGRLADTEATILATEDPDGAVRLNLRSKTWLDVAQLAARFGGGGHTRAAGARPKGAWDDVVPTVIAAVVEALERGPGRSS